MKKILIIDDSTYQRLTIKKFLTTIGYETLEAENGRIGFEMIKSENPDCILLDLLMPEIDGIHVLKMIKESVIKIPVIVMSSDIQDTTIDICMGLGAFSFMNKPFNGTKLKDMLSGLLKN